MSPALLNLILYAPFVIVAGITAAIFFVSGYKKGPYRALFSLGISLIATILSVVLSKLVSWGVTAPIMNLLPTDIFENLGPLSGFIYMVVEGLIQVVLSLVLFSIILFILLIVLKCIGNRIKWEKLDQWDKNKKALKFAGMGIRAIDTVIVSFMLLVPLYGTIATASTPVYQFTALNKVEQSNASFEYIETAAKHPIVSAYKVGPNAWVMDSLASANIAGADISLTEISDVVSQIVKKAETISLIADDNARIEACRELNTYLRENLIGKPWVYDVICTAKDFVADEIEKLNDPSLTAEAQDWLNLLDMSKTEFDNILTTASDVVTLALESGNIDALMEGSYAELTDEVVGKFGSFLNLNSQTVSLKKMILLDSAEAMFKELNCGNDYDGDFAKKAAEDFINAYFSDQTLNAKDQLKEARAMLILGNGNNYLEGFARHPLFGANSVSEYISAEFLAYSLYEYADDEHTQEFIELIDKNPKALTALKAKLKSYEENPSIQKIGFNEYLKATALLMRWPYYEELTFDRALLEFIVNDLGKEFFKKTAHEQDLYPIFEEKLKNGDYGATGFIKIESIKPKAVLY